MTSTTRKTLWFAIPVLGLALMLSGSCGGDTEQPTATAQTEAKSVIVIAVDGLRADHLGFLGASGVKTPALDAIAAESIVFEQAWAQSPSMMPSLTSLLTGLYPTTHGFVEPGDNLSDEATTLAETMQGAGLKTAAFIQGAGENDFGLAQGFETYEINPEPGPLAIAFLDTHNGADVFLVVAGWSAAGLERAENAPEGYQKRLGEVIASQATDTPKLLAGDDLTFALHSYQRHIEHLDKRLGEFITMLGTAGWLDRATLVIAGTSGLALQEHGNLFGEGLYPENIRVPLMIRLPGGAQHGVVKKVVELVDLMPTLAVAAGAEPPAGLQGADLGPIMAGGGAPPYVAFSETDQEGGIRSVVMDGMQLVANADDMALFDLTSDPLAQQDAAEQYPKRSEVLQSHLEAWSKMVAAASLDPERKTEDLDEETLEQLRSLGYIQ